MNTLHLSAGLATARLRDARGAGALDAFAVAAYVVTGWLAFVVASGTWMFIQRAATPPDGLVRHVEVAMVGNVTQSYLALAAIACGLLVFPILGLGGAAARLGARGRARRLASLRLIGMTSGEVVGMSVVESLVQAAAGIVVGALAWALTVPALTLLSFHNSRIEAGELLMPWWLWGAIAVVVLLLAAASTALGLTRVRISPLGVARQAESPALRAWRVAALVVGVLAVGVLGSMLNLTGGAMVAGVIFAGIIGFAVAMVNLFAPWLLQSVARLGVRTGSPARLVAMRRIVADPRSAWRNVASLALIGYVAGMLSTIPVAADAFAGMDVLNRMVLTDVRSGALLTLAIALLVGAASTALAQSADVMDRSNELVALDRLGVPASVDAAARRHQVLVPLVTTLATSMGLGVLTTLPVLSQVPDLFAYTLSSGVVLLGALLVACAVTLLAAESTRPLRARVLRGAVRRND